VNWRQAHQALIRILYMKNQPLSSRLIVFSAFLVVIPMIVVGLISYQRSANVLENEARQYSWQIMEQVKSHVEHYVRDIEIIGLRIINHPDMKTILRMQNIEEVEQANARRPVVELLQNSAYSRSDITNITLILNNFLIIDSTGRDIIKPTSNIANEYWFDKVPASGEPMLVSRVIPWRDTNEPVISIIRRLVNPMTLEPMGMLIIDVNFRRIQEIAHLVTVGRTGYMVILDSQGHYMYHPSLWQLGNESTFEHLDQILSNSSGSVLSGGADRDFLTYSHSPFLGWTLVTSIPYRELTAGIGYIGRTIIWSIVITLGVAYLLGIGLAASIITPVRVLQQLLKRVELGDFSQKAEVASRDELGLLAHGYNKMVERLKELLEEVYFSKLRETELSLQQKESELKVLQAQVNPHFLYNSLETIRGMALDRDMDDIADMASSLARLLRYNLKNQLPFVTLQRELEVCELYLRVQKYRFEEQLNYEFLVPEHLLEQQIVKFSLQPLVENCVVHGFEPGIGSTNIRIIAESDTAEGILLVTVSDTGVGMSEEKLQMIQKRLEERETEADTKHIGIENVHRRIKHLFGDVYGITVDSSYKEGTSVRLKLPYRSANSMDMGGDAYAERIVGG
jgi:two-component system, sensor histidine kinase YesM